ncbi:MAG: alanine--tRNA ligase, partial [Planctomycetota bacterium]
MRPASEIRQQFIDFFAQRAGHTFHPSSPVVPHDDPTLLFANAGMNQFKPAFLGELTPGSPLEGLRRAVNSQKCIRAGGKHNDLDDVGRDSYHHTFFEMLGNWSFGDYFKAEAIQWAWELLTDIWGVDPERLYATYFEGDKDLGLEPDRAAYDLWLRYLPPSRVLPGNMKDNFWEMGDTGPCGPCSELHYDGRTDEQRAQAPGHTLVNMDHDNVIEVWNLVFIQHNRTGPTSLIDLPAKHVDTGMGFERIVRVLQGKDSNYDTDVFAPYFDRIRNVCDCEPYGGSFESDVDTAYRVIADHVRTLTVAIADGSRPGNTGREYVLRSILRRAVRYGRQTLGMGDAFLHEIVPAVVDQLGPIFPEVATHAPKAAEIIREEEEAFGRTLTQGLVHFDTAAKGVGDSKTVRAEDAFKLHDTYGFPIGLTSQMAQERGLSVDTAGFERLMGEAREKSKAGAGDSAHAKLLLGTEQIAGLKVLGAKPTDDSSKFEDRAVRARVVGIWNGTDFEESVNAVSTRPDQRFAIVFDKTNFYAEQGGQTFDTGRAFDHDGRRQGEVDIDAVHRCGPYVVHIARLRRGEVHAGEMFELRVDRQRRDAVRANHTATHVLNYALREVLGDHVDQKGSLVAAERLRFDFSHAHAVTDEEAVRVEAIMQRAITADHPVRKRTVALSDAQKINGLRAVFGETYPDPVRVVAIGGPLDDMLADPADAKWRECSVEFCGGTHLDSTGGCGAFAIVAEESVSKGVRRVVALTGAAAVVADEHADALMAALARAEGAGDDGLAGEIARLQEMIDTAEIPLVRRPALVERLGRLRDRAKGAQKAAAKAGREG